MTHSRNLSLILGTLLLGVLMATGAQAQDDESRDSRLHVQAQTTLDVVPDRATLNARLWERTPAIAIREDTQSDPEALREARDRLEERTGDLIRTLKQAGLESESIRAGSLNVRPEYIPGPRHGNDERDQLVRTQLERPITLTIKDIEQLPTILDALTQAGVNALDGVEYDLSDRDAATDRALTQALEKARHKAELMAETLGISLGKIVHVRESQAPIFAPRMMAMRADAMESQGAAPEYRPGKISIDAGVEVSWEIEN
ncbi:hypothetical protein L861_15555 [Litchfieldella anticariensis FP35 = DSM 16096]|uniref:SIMPL domain-containing protein n=1 Tax=Litchfieldella anticariensis (strain DSM 16096 / CECT 5854 / CIP 108499 / LMG 22089 / FP35) TaxID=1121939 RepID=S2KFT0_LITA3|nr:SIMPL domain-containing protein [Halomonas anticariensis]EPC00972.1 hypothetical protein L861_15555 [Halomonas anticariensis FP35 = DSM 16096]